jgi:hypothetical protein
MAKISTIKEAILICRAARITPYIWGHRGLGKSSLVDQLTKAMQWGFIDTRCSQMEASDLRGLPDKSENRTIYLPPADMPVGDLSAGEIQKILELEPYKLLELQPRYQNGILFLDETNRAQDDVLQAIFQLIYDGKIGTYALPPGWSVVCAGNYMEGYQVSGFNDPAFLDRFCHLIITGGEATLEEWVDYISNSHGSAASEVIEFASQNIKHLDGELPAGDLGFSIQPSRRSWETVIRVQKVCASAAYSEEAKIEVLSGLIGRELALSFSRYSCPVKPKELLRDGVKRYETKLKKLSRNELTGLMWGLVSYCKHKIDDDQIANVCLDFALYMLNNAPDKDVVVAFCRALVAVGDKGSNDIRSSTITNKRLAQLISQHNQKAGGPKTFVDRLMERPELQDVLARVSWGSN